MKKTLLILGLGIIFLASCEKSPTFEECRLGTVISINETSYVVRNNCSGNLKEIALWEGIIEKEVTLNKPW